MSKKKKKEKDTNFYTKKNPLISLKIMKKDYTISIYTGGVDIDNWANLTKLEKSNALDKYWYVRWMFLSPVTNKMVRQTNISKGVNYLETKGLLDY